MKEKLHLDHSKSVPNALASGLDVYSCKEVCDKHQGVKLLKLGSKQQIGSYIIQPFPLAHSTECLGFLIEHEDMGRMVFALDCNSIPYKFNNIHHFCIEMNYHEATIIDNACDNKFNSSASENHLSMTQALEFVRLNYSSSLQSVTALHLSDRNSDQRLFKKTFYEELGLHINIADKNMILELKSCEF